MKTFLILLISIFFSSGGYSQNVEQLKQRIEKKIADDQGYSTLFTLRLTSASLEAPSPLSKIDPAMREFLRAKLASRDLVDVFLLKESDEFGDLFVPVQIQQLSPVTSDSVVTFMHNIMSNDGREMVAEALLPFSRMFDSVSFCLRFGGLTKPRQATEDDPEPNRMLLVDALARYASMNPTALEPLEPKRIVPIAHSGLTNLDNTDFLNYAVVHSNHSFVDAHIVNGPYGRRVPGTGSPSTETTLNEVSTAPPSLYAVLYGVAEDSVKALRWNNALMGAVEDTAISAQKKIEKVHEVQKEVAADSLLSEKEFYSALIQEIKADTLVRKTAKDSVLDNLNSESEQVSTNLGVRATTGEVRPPYYLDLSFSKLSISHDVFTSFEALGIPGFGFEAGFGDEVLNLLSFQAPYLRWGVRALVGLSGRDSSFGRQDFFELRVLGRTIVNTSKFLENSRLGKAVPMFSLDPSPLNSTPGIILDLSLKRFDPRLPFISVYMSFGGASFDNPKVTIGPKGNQYAFFSTSQWKAMLSYFWNTDAQMRNRFRLDLGAGAYNVALAQYDSSLSVKSSTTVHGMTSVQVYVALDYTHCSSVKQETLFGCGIRLFDNRLTLTPWIKILRIYPHEVRLESTYVTSPLGRLRYEWETQSASILQLRYRYGLD